MELSLSPSSSFSNPSSSSSSSSSSSKNGEFEFPLSSSSSSSCSADYFHSQLDHQNSADELFSQGKLLPLLDIPPTLHLKKLLFTHQNFIIPINTEDDENRIIPVSSRINRNLELDNDTFFEWSKDAGGFTHHLHNPPKNKRPSNNWPLRLFYKIKASRVYIFIANSATCSRSSANNNKDKFSSLFEKKLGFSNNYTKKKKISLRDLFFEGEYRKSFAEGAAIQRQYSVPTSLYSSSSLSSAPSFLSSGGSSNDFMKRSRSADPELETSIKDAIAHCKLSHNIIVELEEEEEEEEEAPCMQVVT